MLKKIVLLCASCVIMLASVTVAYAGYGPAVTVGNGAYILTQLCDRTGNIVADVSPSAASYTYKVTVGYGSLSDICATANGYGLTCSLYYNSSQGVYVIRVHDGLTVEQLFNFTSTYGVLANSDGFVYTAKSESTDVSVDTSGIIKMLQTIQSAIAGVDNSLGNINYRLTNILNAIDEGFTMLGSLIGYTNSYIQAYGDALLSYGSTISSSLANLENKVNSLMGYSASISTDVYSISNTVNSIYPDVSTIASNTNEIYAKVSTISDRLASWSEWFNSMYVDLYAIRQNSATIASDVHTNLSDINTTASAILEKLDNLNITTSVNYDDSNILYYLGAIESEVHSISSGVDSISSDIAAIKAQLITGGPILIRLNSIQSSAISILEKLDNLKTYDDTNLIAALGRIENNFGDINTTLGDLNVTTDFTDTNIVAAVNNLASLFSLGETQTLEAGGSVQFSADMDAIQSVSVSSAYPLNTGYVFFSGPSFCLLPMPGFENIEIWSLCGINLGCRVLWSCDSFDYSISLPTNCSGTLSFYDTSGNLISFDEGDIIRPSATVGRWEVARASGGTVSIADVTGLPDGVVFSDLFFPCALVPIRDLVASPSLFSSYCRQVSLANSSSVYCSVMNVCSTLIGHIPFLSI